MMIKQGQCLFSNVLTITLGLNKITQLNVLVVVWCLEFDFLHIVTHALNAVFCFRFSVKFQFIFNY